MILVLALLPAAPTRGNSLADEAEDITLAAVGDMMLARSIGVAMERNSKQSPFAGVEDVL